MAKQPPSEAQDTASATVTPRKNTSRRQSSPRDIRFGEPDPNRNDPEPLTSESSSGDEMETQTSGSEPSDEDIRIRAYHRYLERGGGHGADFDDWLEAERELKERR
jgi:DUF2934 family protein